MGICKTFIEAQSNIKSISLLLSATLLLASCSVVPYRTSRNEAICPQQNEGPLTPCVADAFGQKKPYEVSRATDTFSSGLDKLPKAFVGLALSGGGSRAANFSMAVMEQLEEIGLMRHVTAISATSGGGVAGAYYALHGPNLDWNAAKEKMGLNFRDRWIARSLSPINLVTTAFTHEDRSDLMADIFDDLLFGNATYSQLGQREAGKPIFLANATFAGGGGRFTFDDSTFREVLASRLDTFPISQAVVASAAFPGAFNAVTLKRFPSYPLIESEQAVPQTYVHLIDGGSADNLGVEALVKLALNLDYLRGAVSNEPEPTSPNCFLIIVDAYAVGTQGTKSMAPDPRSWYDHIVDSNLLDAFDTLLSKRRQNLLAAVGLGIQGGMIYDEVDVDGLFKSIALPEQHVVEFDIPKAAILHDRPWTLVRPALEEQTLFAKAVVTRSPDGRRIRQRPMQSGSLRCYAWHMPLTGLMTIKPFLGAAGSTPVEYIHSNSTPAQASAAELQHRAKLTLLLSQLDTNWKLTGPKDCSTKTLQDAVYAAAFVSVREDHASRTAMCDLLEDAGLPVSEECRIFPGNLSTKVPINLDFVNRKVGSSGLRKTTEVSCKD